MKNNSILNYYSLDEKERKKHPNIYNLLLELNKKEIKCKISFVRDTELPTILREWIAEYENLGERDLFIWKWLWNVFKIVRIPGSETKDNFSDLVMLKVALTMFIVLVDDVAENSKDEELFKKLVKIPDQNKVNLKDISPDKAEYVKKAIKLWDYILNSIKEFPKFKSYENLFRHDFKQTINSIRYSYLANKNYRLINSRECWHFSPYNMNVFAYFDFDLMFSEEDYRPILNSLRPILYNIQKMARIGNWLSTWEREVYEDDYVNAVIAKALEENVVSLNELKKAKHELIIKNIKNSEIEKEFLKKWEFLYKEIINNSEEKNNSKLFEELIFIPQEVLKMHLFSKGYK